MYKGIKLSNSNLPSYLTRDTEEKPYKLTFLSNETFNSIQTSKVKIKLDLMDPAMEERIVNQFQIGEEFLYHNTVIYSPLEPIEQIGIETQGLPIASYYDRFNYNSKEYIEFSNNLSELELPNFYLSKIVDDNVQYKDLFCFKDSIESDDVFNDLSKMNLKYNTVREEEDINRLKNIFLSKAAKRYGEQEKKHFPFAIDIKFNFNDIDILSQMLDTRDLHEATIYNLERLPKEKINFKITTKNFQSDEVNQDDILVSDISDLINFSYYPKKLPFVYLPSKEKTYKFDYNIKKIEMNKNFNQVSLNKLPNISNMLQGLPVANEILYIKIEKYEGERPTGSPMQSFWLRDAAIVNLDNPDKDRKSVV